METSPPVQPLVTPEAPWLGLRAFTEEVRDHFFGREREVADLFERAAQKGLTLLFGQSGLGKTSLLQAALIPRLRHAGFLPVLLRLDHSPGAPPLEAQVLEALRGVLDPAAIAFPAGQAPAALWRLLHDPACGLCRAGAPRLVLLLDQFEEIFTLGEAGSERRAASHAFLHALAEVVENRIPPALRPLLEEDEEFADRVDYAARPLKVLLSLREDFLHRLERWRPHLPSLMDNRFELRLLTGPQALEAAVEPGRLRCVGHPELPPIVSPEVGAAIVRFVAGVDGAVPLAEIDAVPPLLSLLCAELNAQRGESLVVRAEQLEGQAGDILAAFYTRCFVQHPPAVRRFVEDRLLSPEGFRQTVNEDTFLHELETGGLLLPDARRILARLVDDRILVTEERGGIRRLELTHDTLTGIARKSRDLRQGRDREGKRRRQRQRTIAVSFGLALIVAGVSAPLAVLALREKHNAEAHLAEAVHARTQAQNQEHVANAARREAEQKNIISARSDRVIAQDHFANGRWRDGFAYLARALEYDPASSLAAEMAVYRMNTDAELVPLQILNGHTSAVNTAQFSADGQRLVTASNDRTARVWEVASGKLVASLQGHASGVTSAQFSADGQRLVTASDDQTARVWEIGSGKLLATLRGHTKEITGAVFSPDGQRLVTVSSDQTARVWEVASGSLMVTLKGHTKEITGAAFSPDGQRLVTVSLDQTARVWEVLSGILVATLNGHTSGVNSAQFSPDGQWLLTASGDQTARVWEASSGKLVATLQGHTSRVAGAQFSPDGQRLATASGDQTARVWETASGKLVATLQGHTSGVTGAQFSPDGHRLVTASNDRTARVWGAASGKLVATLQGHTGEVNTAQFSPDGQLLVTASDDHTARVWEAASGRLVTALQGHTNWVNSAQFSPDGERLVTTSWDQSARVWEAASGRLVAILQDHANWVTCAQFSRDGQRLVTASNDQTARVWEAASGKLLATLRGHTSAVNSAQFSPDGQLVLTGSWDRTARVWEAASGNLMAILQGHGRGVNSAQFSPDGQRLVTASDDQTARVWEAANGKLVATLQGHTNLVTGAQFSPDGQRLVTASWDQTARVWEASSGKLVATLQGHTGGVTSAQFSPDGQRLVTASWDQTARVWEAASGKLVATLQGHTGGVTSAQFSPDGQRLVTASWDQTARVWEASSGKLVAILQGHTSGVNSAQFSPDGLRLVTASGDQTARVWETLGALRPAPQWFRFFLEWHAQRRLNPDGELEDLPDNERRSLQQLVANVALNGTDRFAEIAKYFLLPPEQRPIRPGSRITARVVADSLITSEAEEVQIQRAYDLAPTHPLAALALSRFEKDSVSAAFLRRYGVDRVKTTDPSSFGPPAGIWARAAEMLEAAPDGAKVGTGPTATLAQAEALSAVEHVLAREPGSPRGWRVRAKALSSLKRWTEASVAWRQLLSLPEAEAEDFGRAGYEAANAGDAAFARSLMHEGETRFPKEASVFRYTGWALIDLEDWPGALRAFTAAQALLKPNVNPSDDSLAGLALSQWLSNDRATAIATYGELATARAEWAYPKTIVGLKRPVAVTKPLEALRAATVAQYPGLAPPVEENKSAP